MTDDERSWSIARRDPKLGADATDDAADKQRRATCETVPLEVQREKHPDVLTRLGRTGASLVLLIGVIALVVTAAVMLHSWCECPVDAVPR